MRQLSEPPPHDVGLAQLVLGRLQRSLRSPLLDGHYYRRALNLIALDSLGVDWCSRDLVTQASQFEGEDHQQNAEDECPGADP